MFTCKHTHIIFCDIYHKIKNDEYYDEFIMTNNVVCNT